MERMFTLHHVSYVWFQVSGVRCQKDTNLEKKCSAYVWTIPYIQFQHLLNKHIIYYWNNSLHRYSHYEPARLLDTAICENKQSGSKYLLVQCSESIGNSNFIYHCSGSCQKLGQCNPKLCLLRISKFRQSV